MRHPQSRFVPKAISLACVLTTIAAAHGHSAVAAPRAPAPTATITEQQIFGLAGSVDSFWVFDTYDTNGTGTPPDPTLDLVPPPTLLPGYGDHAARLSTGPGTGGSGCARLGGKAFLGTRTLHGTRLSELTALGYSHLVDSTSGLAGSGNLTPFVSIYVDKNGDGAWLPAVDSILIHEPFYTLGAPTLDVWYDNQAIGAGAAGRWHYAGASLPGLGLFVPGAVDLWPEVIAQPVGGAGFDPSATTIGDLRIVNPPPGCAGSAQGGTGVEGTGSGLSIAVGQKSGTPWNDFVAFVDAAYLTVAGSAPASFVHDFDVVPVPASAAIVSGAGQSTTVHTAFDPLVVELRDGAGDPLGAGAEALIVVPASGASAILAETSATTIDASGQVRFYPVANAIAGSFVVELRSTSGSLLAQTTLTNTAAVAPTAVLVTPSDVQGLGGAAGAFWTLDTYDTNPSTDNPVGNIASTANPAPAAGFSSLQMLPGGQAGTIGGNPAGCTGAGGVVYFGTTRLAGLALRDLDRLGYAAMLEAIGVEDASANLLPVAYLYVDFNADGVWLPADDGILVHDPARGNLAPPYGLGQWYDLADLTSPVSTANWLFQVRSPFVGDIGLNQPDPGGIDKFQELLYHPALKPAVAGGVRLADLRIVNPIPGCGAGTSSEGTGSGLVFAFGQKNGSGFNNMDAHIDAIGLATSGGGALDLNRFHDLTECPPTLVTNVDDSGPGSLRQVIADACAGSTISFDPVLAGQTIVLASTLALAKDLGIDANVAITISGNDAVRVFDISSGAVTLSRLTIANGRSTSGAGIHVANAARLTLTDSTVRDNVAIALGGGIHADVAAGTCASAPGLVVRNSTISGNSAAAGGGIHLGSGVMEISHSTIADNSATAAAGGGLASFNDGATCTRIGNSVIAGNNGSDVAASATTQRYSSLGHNLIGVAGANVDFALEFDQPGDQVDVAVPMLAPLANYGGATATHALLPGSPALNAGSALTGVVADQRGIARPQQGTIDIGAFESRGFVLTVAGGDLQSTAPTTLFALPLTIAVASLASGEPVDGGAIRLAAPLTGASATLNPDPATIVAGLASAVATANTVVGGYTVSADTAGAAAPVEFSLRNQEPTTTTIASHAPDPSVVGQAYTVNVSVSGLTLSPPGSVSVSDGAGPGAVSCGPVMLVAGSAPFSSASCALVGGVAGSRTLTAVYTPADSDFAGSSGTAVHQVNPAGTTISVSGPPRSRIHQPTSFSFALGVMAPGAGTPTGTVTLSSGASSCTATLPATSCELSFDALGSRTVSASYAGDANFNASASSGTGNAQTLVYALADLAISKNNGVSTYEPGDLLVYSVIVSNLGPDAAANIRIIDTIPAGLIDVVWSCDASGGVACPSTGGAGNLDVTVASFPVGGLLNFTFYGNVDGTPLQIANTASIGLPADATIEDPAAGNDSATDTDLLEGLLADGFEDAHVNAPSGSQRIPALELARTLGAEATIVLRLRDAQGEAVRVYARLHGDAIQYVVASRASSGKLRPAAWVTLPGEPMLHWTARQAAGGWVVETVDLR